MFQKFWKRVVALLFVQFSSRRVYRFAWADWKRQYKECGTGVRIHARFNKQYIQNNIWKMFLWNYLLTFLHKTASDMKIIILILKVD